MFKIKLLFSIFDHCIVENGEFYHCSQNKNVHWSEGIRIMKLVILPYFYFFVTPLNSRKKGKPLFVMEG